MVILLLVQAQFSQMRPVAMAPAVAPRMPMYPPGGPGLGQQIFYGQAPPAIMPPQVSLIMITFLLHVSHSKSCRILFYYIFLVLESALLFVKNLFGDVRWK